MTIDQFNFIEKASTLSEDTRKYLKYMQTKLLSIYTSRFYSSSIIYTEHYYENDALLEYYPIRKRERSVSIAEGIIEVNDFLIFLNDIIIRHNRGQTINKRMLTEIYTRYMTSYAILDTLRVYSLFKG